MKNIKFIYTKITVLLGCAVMIMVSCERELSDEAVFATFPTTPEIFNDNPVGLGTDFYFPYGGSKPTAWSVDEEISYLGTASMRFDVPNANDPEGNYAGAIFRVDGDGSGRNLSEFNALTFWAKASQAVTIGEVGFGEDFGENKYLTTRTNVDLTTNWIKYIIPIPDPSKLIQERGMLRYSAGGIGSPGNEVGYTFWFDEVQFEKLGSIGQPQPKMLNGVDVNEASFIGTKINIVERGLTQTYNLGSGVNQTVNAAPSYFTFKSSEPAVASVNEFGVVTVLGSGIATITAEIAGVKASGSLTINSVGNFTVAPIPTRNSSNVISIFSDSYTSVPVDFFNGFWEPFQTTLSSDFIVAGNNMINYTNFNFVGNQFANPTVDGTEMTHLHVNMYIPDNIPPNLDFLITVRDFGPDKADGGGDDTFQQIFFKASDFEADTWSTLEAPLTLSTKNSLGLIIYENINGSPLQNFYLDNIYFYK